MRPLLDTHILLWALVGDRRLDARTRDWIEDQANDVLFGAASIWEIAIWSALRKPGFGVPPDEVAEAARATSFIELAVQARATVRVASLPPHHRDPFDRMLVAQAIEETVRPLTADPMLASYPELVTLVARG